MKAMTQFEEALAEDVTRIAKRLQRFGGTPMVTLVVRPPRGSGERDIVMTTDEPETAIATIRRITGRAYGAAAFASADARPAGSRPPEPSTIEEARYEGMGFVLGTIDAANGLKPSPGMTAAEALVEWSVAVERMAHEMYGDDWTAFVERVRRTQ